MGRIGPKLTQQELEKSGKQTMKGLGAEAGLPGVRADALHMDPKATRRTASSPNGSAMSSPR